MRIKIYLQELLFSFCIGYFDRSNHGNSGGGCSLPNAAYPLQPNSTSSLPQAIPHMTNQEPVMQQPFCPVQQPPSDMSQMPLQQNQTPQTSSQSSQLAVCEVQRQFHQTDKVKQQLNLQVSGQQVLQRYIMYGEVPSMDPGQLESSWFQIGLLD